MRDRLAARHLALGALDIDMDPLMIAGRVGEFVDLLLGHREPVADPDLLAFIGLQIGGAFHFQHPLLLVAMLFVLSELAFLIGFSQCQSQMRSGGRPWPTRHMTAVNDANRRPY